MAVSATTSSTTSSTARSRLGRLYWRVAEALPAGWRPRFAHFATSLAHGRRVVRRVRRRTVRRAYHLIRPMLRRRAGVAVVQRWARRFPPVRLPGNGPVWLVDARGVAATEVAAAVVAHRQRPGAPRLVALVDDPRVDALRSASIVYEYVPTSFDQASQDARRELVTWSYGIQRQVLFTDL